MLKFVKPMGRDITTGITVKTVNKMKKGAINRYTLLLRFISLNV